MNLGLINNNQLTPEQKKIIKAGLAEQIQAGMSYRGVKDNNGKPIPKYAFLKKRHIKKIKYMKISKTNDGRMIVVRVL